MSISFTKYNRGEVVAKSILGMGRAYKVGAIALALSEGSFARLEHVSTDCHRLDDIKYCVADAPKVTRLLGWRPNVQLEVKLVQMAEWFQNQRPRKEVLDRPFVEHKWRVLPQ